MADKEPDWTALEKAHPQPLVQELRSYFNQGGYLEITPAEMISETAVSAEAEALGFLREIVSTGALREETRFICPHCTKRLTQSETGTGICPECEKAFADADEDPQAIIVFVREAPPSRDVRWVLTLHGMNTQGNWQEEFSWLISRTYRHMVPIAIYKYGIVRSAAFLRFRQRALTQDLTAKMTKLMGETQETGFGRRPDIIAHSFGTWLLGHALETNPELNIGRIILTGCILRPDFDWKKLIARGQVEAVLNHYGTRDFWALIAHYFIPDSGPSGRQGFDDRGEVINVEATGFRHSDFFDVARMRIQFENVWRPFLRSPRSKLHPPRGRSIQTKPWKQASWFLRATLPRYLLLLVCVALLVLLSASLITGIIHITGWVLPTLLAPR